jgi:hypothetical protein
MSKPKSGPQKGDKRRYLREAIESLGLDAKYADAAKWVKKKYGIEVSDPTFYHLRKEMQQEARRGQPGGGPEQPSAEASEPTPAGAAAPQAQTPPRPPARAGKPAAAPRANARPTGPTGQESGGQTQSLKGAVGAEDGVAALVFQAKSLVARLGKEEAKRLIDAL